MDKDSNEDSLDLDDDDYFVKALDESYKDSKEKKSCWPV